MLDSEEDLGGKVEGEDAFVVGRIEIGEEVWRDGEEREVFDVWVTTVIFSVSFQGCFIFNFSKEIDVLCGVIGDHCFF